MSSSASVPTASDLTARAPGWALVTGATAGLGREFAEQLARRGHDLVLVARDEARLAEAAAALRTAYGVEVEVLPADLADRDQLARVEDRLGDAARPVELLVNNAGFGLKQRFLTNDVEDEQRLLDVLVVAVMRLSHAALRPMAERGRGGVINVSSVAAWFPRGTYSAAKAWVNSFSRWAHVEYAGRGVSVTAVCPGFVQTEFHQRLGARRGSGPLWLTAERVVREGLADHAAGRAISMPTRRYRTLVRVSRVIPARVAQRFQGMGRR